MIHFIVYRTKVIFIAKRPDACIRPFCNKNNFGSINNKMDHVGKYKTNTENFKII